MKTVARPGYPNPAPIKLSQAVHHTNGREANIIPIINMTFLLLLFFMVAGSLTEAMRKDVFPPTSASAAPSQPDLQELMLTRDGKLLWQEQPVTVSQWAQRLSAQGTKIPATLRLRADAGTRAAVIIPLLAEFKALKIARVSLVTINDAKSQ